MTPRGQTFRIVSLSLGVTVAYLALGTRLVYLHVGDHHEIRERQEDVREFRTEISARRGRIIDRNGQLLAVDRQVHHVAVDPQYIHNNSEPAAVVELLSLALKMEPAVVGGLLSRTDRKWLQVQRFIEDDAYKALKNACTNKVYKGVLLDTANARKYPVNSLMAHVVGYCSSMGKACAGVELTLDKYLQGINGVRVSKKDGLRKEVYTERSEDFPPIAGADVQLTLDQFVQVPVERALDEVMEKHTPLAAWAIVMRTRTGEILAMASKPDNNPNEGFNFSADYRVNHAITSNYEPGSTLKPLVVAAALQEGIYGPKDIIDCENGYWLYAGIPLRDVHGSDQLTVEDVVKKSSNIGTAKISLALGAERLESYYHKFGLGQRTGIQLPYEDAGIFAPRSRWSKISITRLCIGQEISVPAIQVLNAINTIANDGFRMRPTIVKKVTGSDGEVIYDFAPEVMGRVIDAQTSQKVRRMMARVTEEGGTGKRVAIDHCRIAAKTGTAQKALPNGGGYSKKDYIASFVGFFPAERPEVTMIVVVDSPRNGYYGGTVAGPAFKAIAEELVLYLNIPPDPEPARLRE